MSKRKDPPKPKKYPSPEHYESNNPTISARVPLELKNRLEKRREANGSSWADMFWAADENLGKLEKRMEEEKKASYAAGYKAARMRYGIDVKCPDCGNNIFCDSQIIKDALKQSIYESGILEGICPHSLSN